MFADFFIDPLLKEEAVNAEVNAVNSEYENDLQSNAWRVLQLFRLLASKDHAFHRFNIGNLKTLLLDPKKKNLNLRQELVKHYQKYYSSHIMTMTVITDRDLDSMEELVIKKFGKIPNKSDKFELPPKLKNTPEAYPKDSTGKWVWFNPIGKQKSLVLAFPVETKKLSNKNPFTRANDFINHLLGYEGPNSLKSYLRKQGFITSLSVSNLKKYSDFSLILMEMSLTESGIKNVETIVQAFYAYADTMKKDGISEQIYKELSMVSYLNFMYKGRTAMESELSTFPEK